MAGHHRVPKALKTVHVLSGRKLGTPRRKRIIPMQLATTTRTLRKILNLNLNLNLHLNQNLKKTKKYRFITGSLHSDLAKTEA